MGRALRWRDGKLRNVLLQHEDITAGGGAQQQLRFGRGVRGLGIALAELKISDQAAEL